MKQPEDMSLAEIRTELRRMGVTDRLSTLILREMGAAEQRISASSKDEKAKYDAAKAPFFVLKAYAMTDADLTLNRKGQLFIASITREDEELQKSA